MALKLVFACLALVTTAVCDEVVPVPVVPHLMPAAQPCGQNQSLLLPGIGQKGMLQQFVFGSMEKRQSCQPGYGECLSHPGLCCPRGGGCCRENAVCVSSGQSCCAAAANVDACDVGEKCCLNGCAPEGSSCCSNGRYCEPGYQCCSNGGCAPEGAQCCQRGKDGDPGYCERGNRCYESDENASGIQCCTNSLCTAYVKGGTTISATTAAPPPRTTTRVVATVYYTFSWTWSYYAYFYTIYQQESAVRSTLRYTTSTFSVPATNSADASRRASAYIADVPTTPPPDASTQLRTASPSPSPSASASASASTSATRSTAPLSSVGSNDGSQDTDTTISSDDEAGSTQTAPSIAAGSNGQAQATGPALSTDNESGPNESAPIAAGSGAERHFVGGLSDLLVITIINMILML